MGRFNFEKMDRISPFEAFLKEWFLRATDGCGHIVTDSDQLFEIIHEHKFWGSLRAWYEQFLLTDADREQRNIFHMNDADDETTLQKLEGYEVSTSRDYRPISHFYEKPGQGGVETYDAYIRYHDRYYPVTEHSHSFYEIVFLVKGHCIHFVGGDRVEMRTGDIVIVPPDTVHCLFSYNDENIIYNMHIKSSTFEQNFLSLMNAQNVLGQFFRQTLYSRESKQSYFIFQTRDYLLGDNILADICQEMTSDSPYKWDVLNTLCKLLFLHLMRNYSESMFAAMMGAEDSRTIVGMLTYIQTNFRRVSMEDLCGRFNYSRRQISRYIKDYTGSTFKDLQKNLRMKHAEGLLIHTDLPVEQVAADCGYSNTNHFYTLFKETYELTPLAYRQQNEYS